MLLGSLAALVTAGGLGGCIHSAVYTNRVETNYPAEGERVEVSGATVHALTAGAPSAPPVLMIHGASANAREYTASLAPLVSNDHYVIMADRPGHGHSDRLSDARTLGVQAAQMAGALEALSPDRRAVVVGHSFGGAVALRVALDHPDLVSGVVLLAPVSHDWGGGGEAWYNSYAGPPVIGHVFSQLVPIIGPNTAKTGVTGVFHPREAPEGYYERAGVPLLFRPSTFRANARDVNALRDEIIAQQDRYDALEAPVVIFSGAQDTVIAPRLHAGRLVNEAPNVTLIDLPNTGHMPHHHHGEDIADVIRRLTDGESVQTVSPEIE